MDLSLGEFSEVGDTIEEFASENATVVVGTVIDPDMSEELKVTVVATGLGGEALGAPMKLVESTPAAAMGEVPDYGEMDRPASVRRGGAQTAMSQDEAEPTLSKAVGHEDYFDIPAFLRRQAD